MARGKCTGVRFWKPLQLCYIRDFEKVEEVTTLLLLLLALTETDLPVHVVPGPSLFSKPEHSITELLSHNLDWKGLLAIIWSNSLLRANKSQSLPDGDFTASLGGLLKHYPNFKGFFFFMIRLALSVFSLCLLSLASCLVPLDLQGKSSSASYTLPLDSCRQR